MTEKIGKKNWKQPARYDQYPTLSHIGVATAPVSERYISMEARTLPFIEQAQLGLVLFKQILDEKGHIDARVIHRCLQNQKNVEPIARILYALQAFCDYHDDQILVVHHVYHFFALMRMLDWDGQGKKETRHIAGKLMEHMYEVLIEVQDIRELVYQSLLEQAAIDEQRHTQQSEQEKRRIEDKIRAEEARVHEIHDAAHLFQREVSFIIRSHP